MTPSIAERNIHDKKRLLALAGIAIAIAGVFTFETIQNRRHFNAQALNDAAKNEVIAGVSSQTVTPPDVDPVAPENESPIAEKAPAKIQSKIQPKTAPAPTVKQKKKKHKAKKHHSESKQLNTVPTDTPADASLVFKLIIDTGKDTHSFDEKILKDSSAFDALKAASETEKFELDYSNSEWGAFVNSVYDIKPTGAFYWMFKVNGKLSDVGSSSYTIKAGDTIEWDYMDTSGMF